MTLPTDGWKNAAGTADESCPCASWAHHWARNSGKPWPSSCSVSNCSASPELGAHIRNPGATGIWIVPMCASCNGNDNTFSLKGGITLVPATQQANCGQ